MNPLNSRKLIAAGSLTGQPAVATGWAVSERPDAPGELLSVLVREVLLLRADNGVLRADVAALRVDVAALRADRGRPVVEIDEAAVSALVHAIALASDGRPFTVSDLLLDAELVAGRAVDQRLHDSIVAAVGEINGWRLGNILRRLNKDGVEFDGLRIERCGKDRRGTIWCVDLRI